MNLGDAAVIRRYAESMDMPEAVVRELLRPLTPGRREAAVCEMRRIAKAHTEYQRRRALGILGRLWEDLCAALKQAWKELPR